MLNPLNRLWAYMRIHKRYWMLPIVLMTLLLSALIAFSQGSTVAPFVYALF